MDKGLFPANFCDHVRRDGAQRIHTDKAADPCGTDVGYIGSLSMCGDVDQLRPGVAPLHACQLDFDPGLLFKFCQQFELQVVVRVCIWNGSEFDGRHVHLTDTFLRAEMVSFMVLRISAVTLNMSASIPSMTAPITGGTFRRTSLALGASLWIVSRIGSMSIVPPSNMLPVITTSKARFSNASWRIT